MVLEHENEIGRKDYDTRIAAPVRAKLAALEQRRRIRCLVLMYGMPLGVAPESGRRTCGKLQKMIGGGKPAPGRGLSAPAREEQEALAKAPAKQVEAEIAQAQKAYDSATVEFGEQRS